MSLKTLLVYPPPQFMDVETPRSGGGLGLLSIAGALQQAGFEADILDASVGLPGTDLCKTFYRSFRQDNGLIRIGMTEDEIAEVIARGGYNVVGIHSNFTPQTRMDLGVARAARRVSGAIKIVAGGVNARALAPRFLESGLVDAVCLTEGERIAPNLFRAWEKGSDLSSVSGIAYLKGGVVVRNGVASGDVVINLDELPFPTWEKLPLDLYRTIHASRGVLPQGLLMLALALMTSAGCWAKCDYCHISFEKRYAKESGGIGSLRFKSVDRVMAEVDRLIGLGTTKLFFEDDTLLANKPRIIDIFTRVRSKGLRIADVNGVNLVHFQKRVSGKLVIDRELLVTLKEAGFEEIVFPVESANQRIINRHATGKLNHETLDVLELVRIAREVGLTTPVNMMIGFPDETEAEMRNSIELGKRLVEAGAPYCTFFIPIPFPGSMLYEYAIANGHLNSNFDTDSMNWKNAVMQNTTVLPERVRELRDWGSEYANTDEHIRMRLEASAGHRWQSGAPDKHTVVV